eukprot:757579-Amphidinium_carterae.1
MPRSHTECHVLEPVMCIENLCSTLLDRTNLVESGQHVAIGAYLENTTVSYLGFPGLGQLLAGDSAGYSQAQQQFHSGNASLIQYFQTSSACAQITSDQALPTNTCTNNSLGAVTDCWEIAQLPK